jgi:hypothetical protein
MWLIKALITNGTNGQVHKLMTVSGVTKMDLCMTGTIGCHTQLRLDARKPCSRNSEIA